MSLKEDFEKIKAKQEKIPYHKKGTEAKDCFSKQNDWTLRYDPGNNLNHDYDFLTRVMTITGKHHSASGFTERPFFKIDTEVLDFLRGQLIKLGGKPPELPKEKEENPFKKNRTTTIIRDGGLK